MPEEAAVPLGRAVCHALTDLRLSKNGMQTKEKLNEIGGERRKMAEWVSV